MVDAVILAGGKGTRMGCDLPKALVPVRGKPIVSCQLDYFLNSRQVRKIVLSLGHRADEVIDYVERNYPGKNIDFAVESRPLGTAGGMRLALSKSVSDFVVGLNCDDIADISVSRLAANIESTICVANPRLPFGSVVEKDGYVWRFEEKPLLKDVWVSCGWYLFDRRMMLDVLPREGSLEYDVFPNVKLRLYKHVGFWKPLNMRKDIDEFEKMVLPCSLKKFYEP